MRSLVIRKPVPSRPLVALVSHSPGGVPKAFLGAWEAFLCYWTILATPWIILRPALSFLLFPNSGLAWDCLTDGGLAEGLPGLQPPLTGAWERVRNILTYGIEGLLKQEGRPCFPHTSRILEALSLSSTFLHSVRSSSLQVEGEEA